MHTLKAVLEKIQRMNGQTRHYASSEACDCLHDGGRDVGARFALDWRKRARHTDRWECNIVGILQGTNCREMGSLPKGSAEYE